tara:strand:- start:343 stop:519 length:177 start_codon:yes stop_codon:yes gene_type:complete
MKFKMYRVLRDGTQIEDRLYYTWNEANLRAVALRKMLKDWDPKDARKVSIQTVTQHYP